VRRVRLQRGIALLAALLAVALVSLASLVPLQNAAKDARREREAELIFIGRQYRDAIERFHAATPAGLRQYPAAIEDLLEDRRFPQPRRHLRRLYADPFTGQPDWVLVRVQGRIVGLHSRSGRAPLKQRGFDADLAGFAGAQRISDWRFMAGSGAAESGTPSAPPGSPEPPPAEPRPPANDGKDRPAPPPAEPPAPGAEDRRNCLVALQRDLTTCMNTPPFDPQCRALARERFMQCVRPQ